MKKEKFCIYAAIVFVLITIGFTIDYFIEILRHKKKVAERKTLTTDLDDYILDLDKIIISENDWIE